MRFVPALLIAALAAGQASAHPVLDSDLVINNATELSKRAQIVPVTCRFETDSMTYAVADIRRYVNAVKSIIKTGGGPESVSGYPKVYGQHDLQVVKNLPEGCKYVTLYEWPISSAQSYTGGEPGPDRVLINEIANGNSYTRTYCGMITHRGFPKGDNGFRSCL